MDNDIVTGPVARASADMPSQKSVPIHSGPKVKPAAVSWMRPQPSNGPGHALATTKKSAGSQRGDWDKNAALATAATIQLAKASEAAVRLADMAVRQMAGTAAAASSELSTPAKRRGRKPVLETPPTTALPISEDRSELLEEPASGVKRKRQTGKSQANRVQSTAKSRKNAKKQPEDEDDAEHPGGGDDEDPEAEVEDPDAEEEVEDPDAKEEALIKCGRGTFAGYRPPKEEANLEVFNLKKSSYFNSRRELKQKYPGKLHLCGKSITQLDWWNYLRTQIAKAKSKATKQSPYTKDKLKITISEAGVAWKSKLQALMEDAPTE